MFAGDTYGALIRYDRRTSQGQTITPWLQGSGNDIDQQKFRFPWTPPLVFSPTDPSTLYFGSQYLLATSDGGLHWRKISPDLTGASETKSSGPVTIAKRQGARLRRDLFHRAVAGAGESDLGGQRHRPDPAHSRRRKIVVQRHAERPFRLEQDHLDRSLAFRSRGGLRRRRSPSHRGLQTASLSHPRLREDTWTEIVDGLSEPAFVNAIREDPVRKGLLFAATELGVAVSFDDGDHWQPLQLNLPVSSVRDLTIHGDDLVVATHGRSFWILDDIAPLRHVERNQATSLLPPAPAIRMAPLSFQGTPIPPEIPAGKNPPDGAILDFYLASAPQGEVTLEILDAKNQVVRRFSTADPAPPPLPPLAIAPNWLTPPPRFAAEAGMNRFVWDLRYPTPVDQVADDSDSGKPLPGPQVLPGTYRVKLTADGHSYTQMLKVELDPRSTATPIDLAQQLDLGLKASQAMKRAHEAAAKESDPKAAAALRAVEAQFGAVLTIVESSDRRPSAQAHEIFEEALRKLGH